MSKLLPNLPIGPTKAAPHPLGTGPSQRPTELFES